MIVRSQAYSIKLFYCPISNKPKPYVSVDLRSSYKTGNYLDIRHESRNPHQMRTDMFITPHKPHSE